MRLVDGAGPQKFVQQLDGISVMSGSQFLELFFIEAVADFVQLPQHPVLVDIILVRLEQTLFPFALHVCPKYFNWIQD